MPRINQRTLDALRTQADDLSALIHETYGDEATSLLLYTHTHGHQTQTALAIYDGHGLLLSPRHYGENPFEIHDRAEALYGEGHWTLEPLRPRGTGLAANEQFSPRPSDENSSTPGLTDLSFTAFDEDAIPWPT